MEIDYFITEAMRNEADVDPAFVREIVRQEPTLTAARETLGEYVDAQPVADRIIQELVLEDETVHRPEFAKQMPLIHPRNEQGEFEKFYVEDLGIVGEGRYGLADTQDSENLQLTREERTFLGVADNGDVGMQWEEVDTMSIPEEDLHILQSVIEDWPTKQ